jgi:mono/diheme cytochrome c family protein
MEMKAMNKVKKEELVFDHDYDGIRELDNRLPPWWLYLFYISIVWAMLYMLYYHVLDLGDSSAVAYQKEMNPEFIPATSKGSFSWDYHSPFYSPHGDLTPVQKMEKREQEIKESVLAQSGKQPEESITGSSSFDQLILAAMTKASPENLDKLKNAFPNLFTVYQQSALQPPGGKTQGGLSASSPQAEIQPLTDGASLAAGKQIFLTNCITCHGKAGEGGIGPNLTDDYYLHGRGMTNTVQTITNGVAAKGMISWRGILKEEQIRQVASYVLSLHGTNPPNPKAPQGEKIESPATQ